MPPPIRLTQPSISTTSSAPEPTTTTAAFERTTPRRVFRENMAQLVREISDDDSPPRELGWIIRDQIDYEPLAESSRQHNEFFNKASIDQEIEQKLNEYIQTITDNEIRQEVANLWSSDSYISM